VDTALHLQQAIRSYSMRLAGASTVHRLCSRRRRL